MGRIRSIKPEFPLSETIGSVSRDARLLFLQLFTIVDDSGRARAASRMLASLLYPYDDDARRLIDDWLGELEARRLIIVYMVDDTHYLEITNWLKHQKIDHPSVSKIPEPSSEAREGSRGLAPDLGPRIMDKDQERKRPLSDDNGTSPPNSVEDATVVEEPAKPTKKAKAKKGAGGKKPEKPAKPKAPAKPEKELSPKETELQSPISGTEVRKEAARYYNQICADLVELGVPLPWHPMALNANNKINITEARSIQLRARLKELGGIDGWKAMLEKATASDFLTGKVTRSADHASWSPNIDWFLSPKNVTKVMEGRYDNRKGNSRRTYQDFGADVDAMIKEAIDRDERNSASERTDDTGASGVERGALPKTIEHE